MENHTKTNEFNKMLLHNIRLVVFSNISTNQNICLPFSSFDTRINNNSNQKLINKYLLQQELQVISWVGNNVVS